MFVSDNYKQLINDGALKIADTLYFKYPSPTDATMVFKAIVNENGLEIDGETFNPSTAAVKCVYESLGSKIAINGWLVWQNSQGLSLTQLLLQLRNSPIDEFDPSELITSSPQHPLTRDVVFFFGAGVSIADGAPLQATILPMLYADQKLNSADISDLRDVKAFLREFFNYQGEPENVPNLEYVFGFIDFFLSKGEALSAVYTLALLAQIRESLIRYIHYIIASCINQSSETLKRMIGQLYAKNTNVSIVTLNYDTLFEDSFPEFFVLNYYYNFCYELINYDYEYLSPESWFINPLKPLLTPSGSTPHVLKLMKLHGSLNWLYCNVCNSLMVKLSNKETLLQSILESTHSTTTDSNKCPRDGSVMRALITPPAYKKDLSHPVITRLLIEAGHEVRAAKKVVFIGYSMPEADVHIKAILTRENLKNKEIVVIDPFLDNAGKRRYLQLNENAVFLEKTLENAIDDGEILELLKKPRA